MRRAAAEVVRTHVEAALRGKPGLGPAARALEARDEKSGEARGEARGEACGAAPYGAGPGGAAEDIAGAHAGGDLFLVDSVLLEQLELIAREGGGQSGVRKIQIDPGNGKSSTGESRKVK